MRGISLGDEERTEKALKFMEAGLPVIMCCEEIIRDEFPHPQTPEEWEALSPSELSWVVYQSLKSEEQIFFYELMQRKGIEPLRFRISTKIIDFLKGKQQLIDLLYQDMFEHPEYFHCQYQECRDAMNRDLFQGKDPIPPVDPTLSPQQIIKMNMLLLQDWGDCVKNQPSLSVSGFIIMRRGMKMHCLQMLILNGLLSFLLKRLTSFKHNLCKYAIG